jgi:hypothetical protein
VNCAEIRATGWLQIAKGLRAALPVVTL